MSSKNSAASWNMPLIACIGAYLLLGLLLLPLYRYQINPDGISYISIAQKYLSGDFTNVVNGHWSPLFSWLLVPWLYFGIDPLLAAKLLNLSIGVVTFFAMHRIAGTFLLAPQVRQGVYLSLVPVLLYFAYYQITPDLLLTCLLLFYYNALFHDDYINKRRGMRVGVLGGVCYLAKSYCFPFFLAHFALITALYYLQCADSDGKKKIIYSYLTGMVVFLCISGIWIGLLSSKYGEFTTTTQTAHNYHAFSPEPPDTYHFIAPPNETAISVWEDPYVRISKISWTPFQSLDAFKHWLKYAVKNMYPTIIMIAGFSVVAFALSLGYLLAGLRRPRRLLSERLFLYTFVTATLYAGGYCFILIDERYIWIVCLLGMLAGGCVLTRIFAAGFFRHRKGVLLIGLFSISFFVNPYVQLYAAKNNGREIFEVSQSMKSIIPRDAKVASNGDFYTTLCIAYHLGLKYYGTSEGIEPDQIMDRMQAYGIDYFIGWDAGVQLDDLVQNDFTRLAEILFHDTSFAVFARGDRP